MAIYQGIDTNIAGIELSEIHETTDIELDALDQGYRDSIENTIPLESLTDADSRLEEMRENASTNATEGADAEESG